MVNGKPQPSGAIQPMDNLPGAANLAQETLVLNRAQFVVRHGVDGLQIVRRERKLAPQRLKSSELDRRD